VQALWQLAIIHPVEERLRKLRALLAETTTAEEDEAGGSGVAADDRIAQS
jgi:hypothetical protein